MALYRPQSVASGKSRHFPVNVSESDPPYDEMEGLEYHSTFTPTPALLWLPNEVLDQVASCLVPSTVVHTMEGTSLARGSRWLDATQPEPVYRCVMQSSAHKKYLWELSALVNLALVCRRFRPIAERILYRDISLPTPPLDKDLGLFQYPISSTARLARTLTNRPDLAAHTKSLRLWFLDRRLVSGAGEPDLNP